jgi:hypothetical protein
MKNQPWQDETVQALKQGYQETIAAKDAEIAALREQVTKLKRIEKVAREITVAVESSAVFRLAKPCPHGNFATPPHNHAWFCDDCWIEMQNTLAAIQDEAQ